jgi:formate C-acetyltransferase
MFAEWHGFTEGNCTKEVNVRDFIQKNYTPYEGNAEFLTAPTEKTQQLWHPVLELMKQEREKDVLDVDTKVPTSITAHAAGYIDRDLEKIVGLLSRSTFETRDYALWRDSRCQQV